MKRVRAKIQSAIERLSLSQRFMLASLVILLAGMIGVGQWVGQQIEDGVIHRTAATTALYVDSFVAPNLQELAGADALAPEHVAALSRLLQDTPLGQQIAAFKVWNADGRVLYSTDASIIGEVFPVNEGQARAWGGEVTSRVSDLEDAENLLERERVAQLLETYSPVRLGGTNRIIAVAEFYQSVDDLRGEIASAQRRSWLVVGAATLIMYVLLAGFVRRAGDTIARQQVELSNRVAQLTDLLAQNDALHARVRGAAARTAAVNERFLRRISAELHDGPAQDLGLALLRLDHMRARHGARPAAGSNAPRRRMRLPLAASAGNSESLLPATAVGRTQGDIDVVQNSLHRALEEVRAISSGLGLPQLNPLTLTETLMRAVRTHERRTETQVALRLNDVPPQAPLPIKITLYRVVQEALNNAYRHAGGVGQLVRLSVHADRLRIEISDHGPGFDVSQSAWQDEHLGLIGMRERVESLGGVFSVESRPGRGTIIAAELPLHIAEGEHER